MLPPYRILSLDGGGAWALIQVRCLQQLFGATATGHAVLRRFDLVAANSGGSIVLAALVADMPLPAILRLFCDDAVRQDIFSPTPRVGWRVEHGLSRLTGGWLPAVGPKYSTPRKLTALCRHLPAVVGLCLEDVPAYVAGAGARGPHVLIPAFDYNRQRSTFFRSDQSSCGNSDALEAVLTGTPAVPSPRKAIDLLAAVHASSTAPVNFFDATAEVVIAGQPNYLWDGGVAGYNNPVLAAVTEALANGHAARRIRVLSVGTGAKVFPVKAVGQAAAFDGLVTATEANEGFLTDVRKMATAVVGAPPDSASYVAFTVLNPGFAQPGFKSNNFIRANPSVQPHLVGTTWQPPAGYDEGTVRAIRRLELDAVSPEEVALVNKVCDDWLADGLPNQPVRSNARLECLLGQASFAEVVRLANLLF